ncbi:MAG: cation:proton antiporter, partial [Gemmatimonadaceae bacterium]
VVLTLILAYVSGATPTVGGLAASFLTIAAGGLLVGAGVGVLAALVTKRIDDSMIEITLTVIAAYGSFVLAEQLHLSGVIATVTAGMTSGNYARHVGMSPTTRIAVESFWEYIAFALNSAVFLLLGFSVEFVDLAGAWKPILLGFLAVLIARAAVVFGVIGLLRRTRERVPAVWGVVLTWGGLRGALSLVLALALPLDMPFRNLLITMTAGVVLLSILAQGITMAPLLRKLGIAAGADTSLEYETARGDLRLANAALSEVDRMGAIHAATPDVLEPIRTAYEARRTRARNRMAELRVDRDDVSEIERLRAVRHLLTVERNALSEASRDGGLGSVVHGKLASNAADRLVRLETGEFDDSTQLLDGISLD